MVLPALPLLFASFFVPSAYRCPAQELVQPWSYRSPSGTLELFVDPTERHGIGPGSYRLTREGVQIWARTLPFTLLDVLLRDDGSAAGYAHSEGIWGRGELIVAVLNSDGTERWVRREPRASRKPCSQPEPTACELRPCAGGFAVGVFLGYRDCDWWTFEWSTGRSLEQRKVELLDAPPQSPPAVDLPVSPTIELPLLGHVVFPWPALPEAGSDPRSQAERRGRGPHRVFVDGQGRVWISEFWSRVVHGFDANGIPSVDLVPDPETFRPYRPVEWISVRSDGHLFVCNTDQAIQEFAPTGERVGRPAKGDILSACSLFLPGGRGRWSLIGIGRVELFDGDGRLTRTVDRAASGRWFQDFYEAAMDPDGGLAALDVANPGISSRDPSTWVQLIAATGEARRSLRVPDEFSGSSIAFDGRRIALARGRALLLLNEDGSPIGRMQLSKELGEHSDIFFSPSGSELWLFPRMRAEMFRFAMP